MGCSSSSDGPIADYKSYAELMSALQKCGMLFYPFVVLYLIFIIIGVLEDLEIIVGIDGTKSNEMSGMLIRIKSTHIIR
jgi:hypothetical protein